MRKALYSRKPTNKCRKKDAAGESSTAVKTSGESLRKTFT